MTRPTSTSQTHRDEDRMATAPTSSFSDAERAAIAERAAELRARAGGSDGESDVLAAIEAMPADEQALALAFHVLVREVAPDLAPRTWYGMPAYATPGKKGKVVCHFTGATKGGARYCTVGFTDSAALDDGALWPTAFALTRWSATIEATLRTLVATAAP